MQADGDQNVIQHEAIIITNSDYVELPEITHCDANKRAM